MDAHVEELGAVVDWRRPSPLRRVARSALAVSRTPWASPSSGISRISLTGSFQRAITGEGQDEDGRAGIVGKDAGVSCRLPGAELWSVEQRSDDKRRPDGPEQVRNVVDLGEVFAHERDDGDPLTDLDELDRAAWHRHRFPPADVRVQRAAQVVLVDLLLLGPQSQHGPAGRQDRHAGRQLRFAGFHCGTLERPGERKVSNR